MKKKLIIGLVVILAIGGYAAKSILLAPKPVKPKIAGEIYVLPKSFTFNLANGQYATLTAALVLAPGQSDGASAASSGDSSTSVVGTLPEEAMIRDIITNIVTGSSGQTLISATGRAQMQNEILHAVLNQTDVKITRVLFTDLAVQ